ncbi:Solute carrier family 40 member 2 [Bienertia sinuspersici]
MEDVRLRQCLVDPQNQNKPLPTSLIRCLYIGHFLSRWSARMWEFSVALYMINIWPDSLLLTALYGVVESAAIALFGPIIGQWVNTLTYVKVLQLWTLSQNLSFIVAGITVIALLVNSEDQPSGTLTKLNSVLRRIDLVCKLCAPVVSGFIVSFISLTASATFLALWNIISVCLQYWLLSSVYYGIPTLHMKDSQKKETPYSDPEPSTSLSEQTSNYIEEKSDISSPETRALGCFSMLPCLGAWKTYLNQEVFGSLMTAALEWKGIPAYVIGIARGISAIVGITATFTYPIVESKISTLRTGLWSIWSQWSFLLICVGSIWVKNSLSSAYMLMGGVAISRLGLWMFDLAVIQQMQDLVPDSDRCIVGGVQNSIQSAMDLLGYVMGVIIPNPEHFWVLILISFLVVTFAAMLYTMHIWRVRKHLFHFEKLYGLTRRLLGSSS